MTIADRVLLLHEGALVREGPILDVWAHPGSAWAAEFLGLGNIVEGKALDGKPHVETTFGTFLIKCAHMHERGDSLKLLVRPVPAARGNTIHGRVTDVLFQQDRFKVTLDGGLFLYLDAAPKIGQTITAKVAFECLD